MVWGRKFRWLWVVLLLGSPAFLRAQLTTEDHILGADFWPTKELQSEKDLVGSDVCASCHRDKAASQPHTPMGETSVHAADAPSLRSHPELKFQGGPTQYEIRNDGKHATFTVTLNGQTKSAELLWAFGNGHLGQSYLFKKDDGYLYEARASFFEVLQALAWTPSRELTRPENIDDAMGRRIPETEVKKCFGCHTTGSNVGGRVVESNVRFGITCEACHGPGGSHASEAAVALAAGTPDAARGGILNPGRLTPNDSVDFCGACHISYWDMELTRARGIASTKSQPFRLGQSKCWQKGDARLTCTACHDPHQPLVKEAKAYDHNCLQCHALTGQKAAPEQTAKPCPKATSECSSCHMPKIDLPDMHHAFTDHRIRVARAGEPFPE